MSSYPLAAKMEGAVRFLGVPVHPVRRVRDVHDFIDHVVRSRKKAVLFNLNIHAMNIAFRTRWYRNFIRRAHVVFCDGDGVRWGMRLLGHRPPPKMATTRWIWELADFCAEKGYRLFLVGGVPGVADQAARRLRAKAPDLRIAGIQHGYFKHEGPENDEVIKKINAARPDILMVCMGMPVQEKWILKNLRRTDAHVFLKGGAVLDYVTGRLGQVPAWMVRLHLEWLFRIWEEPRRLFWRYAHDIPGFFLRVLAEKLQGKFISRRSRK